VEKLKEIEKGNPTQRFGFLSIEGFEERIFALDIEQIEELLGPTATARDAHNLQASELRDLVAAVAAAADEVKSNVEVIKPVPVEKLSFNKLPGHWHLLIAGGWQNAHHVSTYLSQHHDPLIGERIAQIFRERYAYLRAQNLQPGAIMSALYDTVAGIGSVTPDRQVAAQALLAFLFESCDIFEDVPTRADQ
jgi:hypothetical protein